MLLQTIRGVVVADNDFDESYKESVYGKERKEANIQKRYKASIRINQRIIIILIDICIDTNDTSARVRFCVVPFRTVKQWRVDSKGFEEYFGPLARNLQRKNSTTPFHT